MDISPEESQRFQDELNKLQPDKPSVRSVEAAIEMPKYKCHKEVWALKIREIRTKHVEPPDGSAVIVPDDARYANFRVEKDYVDKHNPQAGGYYVVYADGYKSYSPAQAFEEGYTLI